MCPVTADTGVHSFRGGNYKARCRHVACVRGIGHTAVFAHEQTGSSLPWPSWSLFVHTQKFRCGRALAGVNVRRPYDILLWMPCHLLALLPFLWELFWELMTCENGSSSFFPFPVACSLSRYCCQWLMGVCSPEIYLVSLRNLRESEDCLSLSYGRRQVPGYFGKMVDVTRLSYWERCNCQQEFGVCECI